MLTALGYETVHAATADQALKNASGIDHPIDLLVVDQHLPGCSGVDLLTDLRARGQPTRAVIVASASAADEAPDNRFVLLRKPFQLADLRRAIAELNAHSQLEPRA
jgi:CheY-like chemotaxis protein